MTQIASDEAGIQTQALWPHALESIHFTLPTAILYLSNECM